MKVLWLDYKKGWMPYEVTKHSVQVWVFLYWENSGEQVILAGCYETRTHKNLLRFADYGNVVPKGRLKGAGRASDGMITGWTSEGFAIDTPENLRSFITESLGLRTQD